MAGYHDPWLGIPLQREVDAALEQEREIRTITIPGCQNHAGHHVIVVTVDWICPECGGPRGEPYKTLSYDGSRRLYVDGWRNPCDHVDPYWRVRKEAGVSSCSTDAWPHG